MKYASSGSWSSYGATHIPNMTAKALSLNIESGSIFEEYDTGDHFIWSGSAWNQMS